MTRPKSFTPYLVFDMDKESITTLDVPEYVPIVGQSLEFLNAGEKGVLIVMGGYTASNKTLSLASLSEIFIYDIAENRWMAQSTTDIYGRSNVFQGGYANYEPGIPNERHHMCTAVGIPSDATSYNIYLFGGQNDTSTPGDIWVLTLPSAIWIRLYTQDISNNPKTMSSCNTINGRYVLMAGGTWIEANHTYSYGWNPLLYDINTADWNWYFDASVAGYAVPKQIFDVIGGTSWGSATQSTPKFTNFSDPLLEEVFGPTPKDDSLKKFHLALEICLPIIMIAPIICWIIWRLRFRGLDGYWQPWALRPTFLCVLVSSSLAFILTVTVLWKISELPNLDHSTWDATEESTGVWAGSEWNTTYSSDSAHGRPNKGLLSFYVDTNPDGTWTLHNAAQRLGITNYFLWTYFPSIVTVIYGILWAFVDGEIKRLEPYQQLIGFSKTKGTSSIDLNYHSFWSPLALWQSLRLQQWTVFFSSLGSLLALIVVPNIQNYVFTVTIYAGQELAWGGQNSYQVFLLDPHYTKVLLAVMAVTTFCAFVLTFLLWGRKTSLNEDPGGIANIVELLSDTQGVIQNRLDARNKKLLKKTKSSLGIASPRTSGTTLLPSAFKDLRQNLAGYSYQITPSPSSDHRIGHLELAEEVGGTSCASMGCREYIWKHTPKKLKTFLKTHNKFKKFLLIILDLPLKSLELCDKVLSWGHSGKPKRPFLFRTFPMATWLCLLVILLGANIYILSHMTSRHQIQYETYHLPWSPNIYLIVGVFVQSIYQVLERTVRSTVIITKLEGIWCPPGILYDDFTTTVPIFEIVFAFHKSYHLLGYVLFGSLCTIVYTIMLGSLQVSAGSYGATTFHGDLDGVIVVLMMNVVILLVSVAVAWKYVIRDWRKSGPLGEPWEMGTIMSIIPLVSQSLELRKDVLDARVELEETNKRKRTVKEKIDYLDNKARRYGFGLFATDDQGGRQLGIERNFVEKNHDPANVMPWKM